MRYKSYAKIAAVVVACIFAFSGANAATYDTFDSGDNSELLTTSPGDLQWRVLYSVDIGTVSAGDIIVVDCEAELTNNTSSDAELSTSLLLSPSASSVGGVELDESNVFNVTPALYHGVPEKHAAFTVQPGTTNHFVNFRVATSQTLVVEQDYGRVQVLVIHP